MSKRNLFVSFAESDGGHSYLAARAMLEPSSVAHLIFRTSVADSLDAVASGQANFAVVPAYNTITQWDGATLKALSTGQFEIFGQICMPTSYVLVAHKDYMFEFVNAYLNLREPTADINDEEAAKIYTRFLTRIFVSSQADEQYRGRLMRPDMPQGLVELSRNPLRVLEEMSRTELFKAMTKETPYGRHAGYGYGYGGGSQNTIPPNQSGGTVDIEIGTASVLSPVKQQQQQRSVGPAPLMETLQAPAALVAAGLLDAPGDPEGWDQPGSLGEIVALLRKLLVLLNVYSFGSPDLPENKTQYLLIGRRGSAIAPEALRAPQAAPTRIMTLVRPNPKMKSADQWLRPRSMLSRRARDHGYVFDRPPLMLSPAAAPVFLFEGGKPKSGVTANPITWLEQVGHWLAEIFVPQDARAKGPAPKDKSLRKALEKKDTRIKEDSPERFDVLFLGQYQTWCPEPVSGPCWCCEEAHAERSAGDVGVGPGLGSMLQFLIASLIALTILGIIIVPIYCAFTGSCNWFGSSPKFEVTPPPPGITEPPPAKTEPPAETPPPSYPGLGPKEPPRPAYPGVDVKEPPQSSSSDAAPLTTPGKVQPPKAPSAFHVAFFESKANLTPESMDAIAAAAAEALQTNGAATVRVVSLGPREKDQELWRRRVYAVKDELVRLGVPLARIRYEGSGPYVITIRADQPPPGGAVRRRINEDLDSVSDPMSDN